MIRMIRAYAAPPNRRARRAWAQGKTHKAVQCHVDSTRRRQVRDAKELGEKIAERVGTRKGGS